jgi:two-component system, response regulator PdtaR
MLSETTAAGPAAMAAPDSRSHSSLKGARVLICEDEAIIQIQLNRILASAGMEVVASALNGKQGVEEATEKHPDIVLMDLNIPVIDGMEASRRIIVDHDPCVVILSAYGDSDFRRRAREIGVCGYLTKPVTSETLLPELERIYTEYRAKKAA